jgi:hypothetical protein
MKAGYKIPFFGGGTDRTFVTLNDRVMAKMMVSGGVVWFCSML